MWGQAYVESNDVFVLDIISLCFCMHHMDLIDVILSRMTSFESMSFFLMF